MWFQLDFKICRPRGWTLFSWISEHWNILESEYTGIRTGPSLRFPMASSQSFLLAVSSLISCFCCSDSWKVSSIFTRLEGGSAAGDDSGEGAHKKKRLNKAAYTWIEKDGVCLRKIRRWWILEHLQAILKTKFHCSHCSHLSFSNNTLTCFELHL